VFEIAMRLPKQNVGVEGDSSVVDQDVDSPALPGNLIYAFLVSIPVRDIEHVGFDFAALLLNNAANGIEERLQINRRNCCPFLRELPGYGAADP
jgi:hypothetical protein